MEQNPIKILKNMRTIVRNEALARVGYISNVVNEDLEASGAVCRGRQACAVGSLWLAAGVEYTTNEYGDVYLPGVERQDEFIEDKPSLKRAYDAMNQSAREYADEHGIANEVTDAFEEYMENLFESSRWDGSRLVQPSDFLPIIDRAMEIITEQDATQADNVLSVDVGWDDVTITFKDGSEYTQAV